jgi:hypothetical protein
VLSTLAVSAHPAATPPHASAPHTGIQFVCGANLCDGCSHGAPPLDNPGWFNLGGGHVPTAVADQQWEDYYSAKEMEWAAERAQSAHNP